MSEENKCEMVRGTKNRLSPNSVIEAYCYQLHDILQILFGAGQMSGANKELAKSQIQSMRSYLDLLEKQLD